MSEFRNLSLDQVVRDVISEEQLDSRDYARLIGIAVRGFYYIYKIADSEVKSVVLPWTNTTLKFIDFPVDYITWRKVGLLIPQIGGKTVVMTLSVNDALKLPQQTDIVAAECTCEEAETVSANALLLQQGLFPFAYYSVFQNAVRGNQLVGEIYGAGGGVSSYGSFREDKPNQRFVFSSEVSTDRGILLEYKANMLSNKDRTVVPWDMREALIAWIKWRMLSRRNSNISEREEQKNNFFDAFNDYYNQQTAMTKDEILDGLYRGLNWLP